MGSGSACQQEGLRRTARKWVGWWERRSGTSGGGGGGDNHVERLVVAGTFKDQGGLVWLNGAGCGPGYLYFRRPSETNQDFDSCYALAWPYRQPGKATLKDLRRLLLLFFRLIFLLLLGTKRQRINAWQNEPKPRITKGNCVGETKRQSERRTKSCQRYLQ